MTRWRMLHLTVNPALAVVQATSPIGPSLSVLVEQQLDQAADWIRYADNCWLFWTDKSAQDWHQIFREKSHQIRSYQYLIVAVDPSDRQGLMPEAVWQWLEKHEPAYRDAAFEAIRSLLSAVQTGKISFKGQTPAVIQQPKIPGVIHIPKKSDEK